MSLASVRSSVRTAYHLALGLMTSPILADCLMMRVDQRIGGMCRKNKLVYTRFVDDITISGSFPIDSGSFPELVDHDPARKWLPA